MYNFYGGGIRGMKIICVAKFVPDVDNFTYNYETHTINREDSTMMINPDDASAVGFALQVKKQHPESTIELVTMAPVSVTPLVEDILRVGVDTATIISDPLFAGSDTYVTSNILGRYLSDISFDVILSGSHAIDGDTSHVPSQIASLLNLDHISNITVINEESFFTHTCIVEVEHEFSLTTYEIEMPSLLSLSRESSYRLPYVRYKNLKLDVSDRITHVSNSTLQFSTEEVGLLGSKTKVVSTFTKRYEKRERKVVGVDVDGINSVYEFLTSNGFV